ncbi:MAG: hypothetical protein JWN99_2874 [Ilumatobacteraceae bacterium]|nr:hypothetical protein [Ilumatobacteraceae bacterium]
MTATLPPDGPFSCDDLAALADVASSSWQAGVDHDWSVRAGTLEWTCWKTADHTIDCVFSYAFFLASRAQRSYPPFEELAASADAQPADLIDGLRAATNMLVAVVDAAPPGTRAIISMRPQPTTGTPADFAARGAHELVLHTHDICSGLGVVFRPPVDLCERLRDHTWAWPIGPPVAPTVDPWSDLLQQSGRSRVS